MSDLLQIKVTRVPFNHRWRDRSVSVIREKGTYPVGHARGFVHPDMAQAAIEQGYAQRFNPRGRHATTMREEIAKAEVNDPADTRESDQLDREDMADDDRPDDQRTDDPAG